MIPQRTTLARSRLLGSRMGQFCVRSLDQFGNDPASRGRGFHRTILFRLLFVRLSVDDFVAVKAHDFNKAQQTSISRLQQVQQQSLRINKIQQISISSGIWFGTRGSEVQILSPRPFFSIRYPAILVFRLQRCRRFRNGRAFPHDHSRLLAVAALGTAVRSLGRISGSPIVHEVAINLVSRTNPKRSAIKIASLRVFVFDASGPAIRQSP